MTSQASDKRHFSKSKGASLRRFGVCYMCLFLLILFLKNGNAAAAWVSEGLRICAGRLIPSIFPFMVVSSLMVSSGAGSSMFKILRRPVSAVFGLGGECCAPIMLGWICGFPVGARCAAELYLGGRINRGEYTRVLCVSSTPSPAFLIGAVGEGMLKKPIWGLALYVLCILSCVTVGVAMKRTGGGEASREKTIAVQQKRVSFAEALTRAVTDSAQGMLYVCAFVVFFSAFLGAAEGALSFLSLSDRTTALLFSFFEMTSGVSRLSTLPTVSFPLLAVASGWSGMSVHFQTAAISVVKGKTFAAYLLSHVAKAALCGIGAVAISLIMRLI